MTQSWIFSIITNVFSVTWCFINHSNMLICCSRDISYIFFLGYIFFFFCIERVMHYYIQLLLQNIQNRLTLWRPLWSFSLWLLDFCQIDVVLFCSSGFLVSLFCVLESSWNHNASEKTSGKRLWDYKAHQQWGLWVSLCLLLFSLKKE